jgi:hypothetical protein
MGSIGMGSIGMCSIGIGSTCSGSDDRFMTDAAAAGGLCGVHRWTGGMIDGGVANGPDPLNASPIRIGWSGLGTGRP